MKKGISLILLLITIAVMITIVSTVTVIGTDIYNNTKKVKFASEISYIEEIVRAYYINNNEYPVLNEEEFNIENITDDIVTEQFISEDIIDNNIKLYQIDYAKLGISELTIANKEYTSNSVYLVSKTTGKIYYKKGYRAKRKIYYTLTEDLKKSINYVENGNVNDGIIFSYGDNLLKDKVEINIKVPISFTDISIISTDVDFILDSPKTQGKYNIYRTISNSNSTITVNYKISSNSTIKTLKYNVNNVDKEIPTFNLSNVITIQNEIKKERYIRITDLNDSISGIKYVKYANQNISQEDAKEYFKNSGIQVSENIIYLTNESGIISVYAEDNAGNFNIKYINID